jgi:ABC-type phosphate transport system substrate-binding protein
MFTVSISILSFEVGVMIKQLTIGRLMAAAILAAATMTAAAEVVVIVHRNNPTASMTAQQVSQIFLGNNTAFPAGASATPVDVQSGALRDEFLAKVLDKTSGQYKATWSRIVFSGKGQPPRELANAAAVKAFVAANPEAIGFVDKGSVDSSVKAVLTVQ